MTIWVVVLLNFNGIHSDLDTDQAETLILMESRKLGLEEHEGFELQGVKVTFEKIDASEKQICNPNIDNEGILHIQLRDVNLISGVKFYFATLVKAIDSGMYMSPILIFIISFLYPFGMFTLSLVLVTSFFISDFLLAIFFGPILFSVLVLPTLLWITVRSLDQTRNKTERMKSKLDQISLFTNKHESTEYSQLVSERFFFGPAMSITMYIVLVFFMSLIIIFGFSW